MDLNLMLQFWVVAALIVLTPGADWAYAITAGLRARSVVPSVLGMVAGYAVVVAAIAVGVGALVTRAPAALTVLTFAGAGYLLWLGVSALFRAAGGVEASERRIGERAGAQFLRGAGVSSLNPKGLLLLLAVLPQFTTSAGGWPPSAQMLALGGLHLLDVAVVYLGVAVLARRVLRARPRAAAVLSRVAGVAMTGIGLALIVEQALRLL